MLAAPSTTLTVALTLTLTLTLGLIQVAFAGHCEQDQEGRPIAAHFNWSPRHLSEAPDAWTVRYLVRVAMHELTHALVFSQPLLAQFPTPGGALAWAPTPDGGHAAAVRSPHVLRAARAHFGCAALRGTHAPTIGVAHVAQQRCVCRGGSSPCGCAR